MGRAEQEYPHFSKDLKEQIKIGNECYWFCHESSEYHITMTNTVLGYH